MTWYSDVAPKYNPAASVPGSATTSLLSSSPPVRRWTVPNAPTYTYAAATYLRRIARVAYVFRSEIQWEGELGALPYTVEWTARVRAKIGATVVLETLYTFALSVTAHNTPAYAWDVTLPTAYTLTVTPSTTMVGGRTIDPGNVGDYLLQGATGEVWEHSATVAYADNGYGSPDYSRGVAYVIAYASPVNFMPAGRVLPGLSLEWEIVNEGRAVDGTAQLANFVEIRYRPAPPPPRLAVNPINRAAYFTRAVVGADDAVYGPPLSYKVMKKPPGGVASQLLSSSSPVLALWAESDGALWLLSGTGQVRRSRDGGVNWTNMAIEFWDTSNYTPLDVCPCPVGGGVATVALGTANEVFFKRVRDTANVPADGGAVSVGTLSSDSGGVRLSQTPGSVQLVATDGGDFSRASDDDGVTWGDW